MPTLASDYAAVAKEVFDSNTLNKMFYDEFPFLNRIEKQKRVIIGKKAHVPLHEQRAGGTKVFDAAGGTLNAASVEDVGVAKYSLAYTWFPVEIQFGALNEITGGVRSVGEAQNHMLTSAVNNIRNQVERQVLTGDALVAQCGTTSAANEIELAVTPSAGRVSGVDAVMNGWLVPGDVVQVGTHADTDTLANTRTITAVEDSLTTPSITIDGAAITTSSANSVALQGSRSSTGQTSIESTGLKEIAGTTGNTVGELSGGHWNPAEVDSTSTLLDMDLLLRLSRRVLRRTGTNYTFCLTSLKQLDNIYSMLQSQVRFSGDKELGAGGSATTKWRNMEIHAFPHVPENVLYFLTLEDLELVFGAFDKPTWASDVEGANRGSIYTPGSTKFSDSIVYSVGLAARRRNSHAAAVNLSA